MSFLDRMTASDGLHLHRHASVQTRDSLGAWLCVHAPSKPCAPDMIRGWAAVALDHGHRVA